MIAYQRPPHIYGEILSASLCHSPRYDLPSLGRFLSQGLCLGALLAFLLPVYGMLSHPENGYNFLLISWLPFILANGIGFGLLVAVIIWALTYVAGHRLHLLVRAIVGPVTLSFLLILYVLLFETSPDDGERSVMDYLYLLRFYIPHGVILGLLIGSGFHPLGELLRGTKPPRRLAATGITGFLLRVLIIVATMYAILILIWNIQHGFRHIELVMAAIAVGHLVTALAVVFARVPFWLLLLLALIINFPVVVLITDVLTDQQTVERNFIFVYLHLWAAFLLCRFSVPRRAVSLEE